MTVEDLKKKIEAKRKLIDAVPQLRKELKELEQQLKQEHLREIADAMEKVNVTPKDIVAALENGLIKPTSATAPSVRNESYKDEKEKSG